MQNLKSALFSPPYHRIARIFWTILLTGAGVAHFFLHDFLIAQMPPYLPNPSFLIHLSGAVELIFAVCLQFSQWRRWIWWGICLMCVSYLPIHWHVLANCDALKIANGQYHIPFWIALIRLPIQVGFIVWTGFLARFRG